MYYYGIFNSQLFICYYRVFRSQLFARNSLPNRKIRLYKDVKSDKFNPWTITQT